MQQKPHRKDYGLKLTKNEHLTHCIAAHALRASMPLILVCYDGIMDTLTARKLSALNLCFYRSQALSFSATRQCAWPGFEHIAKLMQTHGLLQSQTLHVLDFACGNLRFERFLQKRFPDTAFVFQAADSCDELVSNDVKATYCHLDIVDALLHGDDISQCFSPPCDMSVSFAFMHHIPSYEMRLSFLNALCACVRPGGLVAISLWRFLNDASLASKAEKTTARAASELGINTELFDENDRLLGWQDMPGVYRYCHHFDDAEIEALSASCVLSAKLVARFDDDGRNKALNTYLVFKSYEKSTCTMDACPHFYEKFREDTPYEQNRDDHSTG